MKDEKEPNKEINLIEESNLPKKSDTLTDLDSPLIKEGPDKKKKLKSLNSQIMEKKDLLPTLQDNLENLDYLNIDSGEIRFVVDDNKSKELSKYLYILKDFFFLFILLISPGLNFSYLYFPLLLIPFISYFFLLNSGKNQKRCKRVIEIIVLIYTIAILAVKVFFVSSVRGGKKYEENKDFLIDLGILNLLDEKSNYFFVASFVGECFVIIFTIFSIIISYMSIKVELEDEVQIKHNELTLNEFFALMSKCIYLFYMMVVGWAIFNRSILTLIYLMPMNIILYVLSMNYRKNILFYIFKFFSLIITFIIIIHLFLINIFNINSIRNYYLNDDLEIRDGYPRVITAWTKLGINQAFHVDMKGAKLSSEYCGYCFGCAALLVLFYINKKLTFTEYRKACNNPLNKNQSDEIKLDNPNEVDELSFIKKIFYYIKKYIYSSSFILHICRIAAVLWLFYYQNFYSIGVIIWLCFSFMYLRVSSNRIVTIVFLAPMVFVCLFCYHLANIDGFIENADNTKIYRNFALGKFSHKNVEYIMCNIFYFVITLFIRALYVTVTINEKKEEKKILSEKDKLKQNIIIKKKDTINNLNIITNEEPNEEIKEDLIENEFRKKSEELDQLFNEGEEAKEEEIKELYHDLTIANIIIKAIFSNIDKITLLVLYLIGVNSINVVHFVLVMTFMAQLLFPDFMIRNSVIFIILSQIIFLIEYIVDLVKATEFSEDKVNLIKVFIPFDLNEISIDFTIYLMTYCYYFQNQLYNSDIFKKLAYNENVSLVIYIKVIFCDHPHIQKILFEIGNVIMEIYAWILISFFIIFNGLFEISFLFAIKLLLFMFLMYKFLGSVKTRKKNEINLVLNWVLLIFCALNTIFVYIYQFLCLEEFNLDDKIQHSENFFIKNLPALGFYRYKNNNLHLKFFPHFISNIISTFFITEMKRLLNKYRDEEIGQNFNIDDEGKKLELLIVHKKNLEGKSSKTEKEEKKKDKEKEKESTDIDTSSERKKSKEIIKEKKGNRADSALDLIESGEPGPSDLLKENKKKMIFLTLKYLCFNILIIATKFYWLFLFLFILIIFTTYDLSIFLIIYILIFGINFIQKFHYIIMNLSDFNAEQKVPPFFISRLIRFNLIEQNRHIEDNKKYRLKAFKMLITFTLFCYFLIYLDGIYGILQAGCKYKIYDDCDTNNYKLFGKDGLFTNVSEDLIISISYIIGFNVNLDKDTVLSGGWFYILFGAFLCFDVYVQKIEGYMNQFIKANRKEYRKLANENIVLKQKMNDQQNILSNIQGMFDVLNAKQENIQKERNEEMEALLTKSYVPQIKHTSTIRVDLNAKNDEIKGKEIIDKFLKIFKIASESDKVKLSSSNDKMKILKSLKKIFEEFIIFFLICTAISKLNVWSIIYVIISLYFILTQKSMKKYYYLYCFLISSIILQASIFVSNLQKNIDPSPDNVYIGIMEKTFNLPWYKKYNIKDEHAFFFGLGVCHSQINLIWMDSFLVFIIYIYIDYFSYSIYQEGKTIGKSENSINYYNLHLKGEVRKATQKLTEEEYNKHIDCMKYNFGIGKNDKYKYKDKNLKENEINEEKTHDSDNTNESIHSIENDDNNNNNIIENNNNNNENNNNNQNNNNENNNNIDNNNNENNENKDNESNDNILDYEDFRFYILKGRKRKPGEVYVEEKEEGVKGIGVGLISRAFGRKKGKKKEVKDVSENKCMSIVIKFLYLSFHNFILILIITISMMISGLISICYITISLYFLLTSTKIYLGEHYGYPRAIKKLLRIMILVDILLQILYQIPFIDTRNENDNNQSNFYTILGYIGLNKILIFGKDDEGNFEANISGEEMVLVIGKALLYLFMSLQLMIYTSKSFLEYYLAYIITKNNNLRRVRLMNVFKFNNKRIEIMNESIQIRQDMAKKLENLEKTLENLSENVMKKDNDSEESESEKSENNINNDILNIKEVEEEEVSKGLTILGGFSQRNIIKDKVKSDNLVKEKKQPLDLTINQSVVLKKDISIDDPNEKYLTPQQVIDKVKEWVLNGCLIKFQMWLHRVVSNYNNISSKEKYLYERDIIKGKSQVSTMLENLIESELKTIELTQFTEREMKELKQYFDGSRKKRYEELVKKRAKLQKQRQKEKEKQEKLKLKNKFDEKKEKEKQDKEREKRDKERKERIAKRKNEKRVNIRDKKFLPIRTIAAKKIFEKYLSKTFIIGSIFKDVLSFFSNNFKWFCFFIMILNHIMSYSFISLFYPISIFCYGIMEYPRPKKSYWSCCFIYTIIFLVLKFIIQLKVWSQINGFDTFIKYLENYRIGLKLCDNTFSKEFVLYILYDALVLIVLLINNYLLVFDGLFDKREQEVENIYNANERIAMTKDKTFDSVDDMKKFNDEFLLNEENKLELEHKNVIKVFDKLKEDEINEINLGKAKRVVSLPTSKDGMKDLEKKRNLYDESKRGYYESLFPKFRNEKPGKEYYVIYTIAMTLIIIYVFLFYTIMIKDKTFGAVSIETRQFSGEMVLFLLLHIAFLIADRIIYLRQNRKDLKYSYILYDKKQKMIKKNKDIDPIAENYPLFKKTETIIPKDYVYKLKDYYIIYIQKETFNRPMFQKYLMHMFIVIFSHIFIFFFMPMYGNYNLNRAVYCTEDSKECNDFIKNTSLPIFYLLYIVYLISSGLQVKYGFYDMKRKSILKGKSNSIYGGIYSAYKSIPFLYEIKLGIDWTFTTTCLDLFQWNKFESVYDVIYTTNCAMTGINAKQVGNTVGKGSKISMGGVLTFVLVLVLVGPMLLFSSLNPTNQLNNLTNSDLTLELSFIYKNELMKNYTLYQNTRPQTIEPINDADWNAYNYSVCVNTKNFPKKQVETVTFSQENDRNWDLSRPHIKNLIELIQSSIKNVSENEDNYITRIDMILDYTFYRRLPPTGQTAKKRYNSTIFTRGENNEENTKNLVELGNALSFCEDKNITLKNKFSPPIRLRASSHPKALQKENKQYFKTLDIQIGFAGCKNETIKTNETSYNESSYLESYFTLSLFNPDNVIEGIKFHVFSDQASTTTFNYSIKTFYLAFVLVLGTYVRNFFAGQAEKIVLTEMPHNEVLMDLCEGIKISRYSYNFEDEEKYYYILIEIMRSPDILRNFTTSSIDQFEQRLEMTKNIKETEEIEKNK